ncbi:MAG TPA: hypothetical protein PLN69_09330 [bacterium]|nr:hypothetical protein [bacterium]
MADKYDEVISLDTEIYPLESIQLAACGFLDESFIYIFPDVSGSGRPNRVNVAVKTRADSSMDIEELTGKFANELNRQSLRIALNRMNRKVRTQIVGRALASAIAAPEKESTEGAR